MSESTLNYLDSYCERAGSLMPLAEPVNFLTNAAFLIAAYFAYNIYKEKRISFKFGWDYLALIILLALIGIGSGVWHFVPDGTTLLFDVIPILIFINLFFLSLLIRIFGMNWWQTLFLWLVFQGLGYVFEVNFDRDALGGTIMYIPTYLTLLFIAIALHIKESKMKKYVITAAVFWTFSLILRTFDMQICSIFPIGTHFAWHLLNSIVLYQLLKGLMLCQKPRYIRN